VNAVRSGVRTDTPGLNELVVSQKKNSKTTAKKKKMIRILCHSGPGLGTQDEIARSLVFLALTTPATSPAWKLFVDL